MPKAKSKEGDTKACFECKSVMTYRMVPETTNSRTGEVYAARLQWQSTPGTAHYGFNKDEQKAYCKTNAPVVAQAEKAGSQVLDKGEIHLADLKNLTKEQILEIGAETQTMLDSQLCRIYFIEDGLKAKGLNPSGPFVGMLYNQQMEALRNVSG